MSERLTTATSRTGVAEMLRRLPGERLDSENLIECELDAVRVLTLPERWREAGVENSFVEPAELPTPENWLALLASHLPVALDA